MEEENAVLSRHRTRGFSLTPFVLDFSRVLRFTSCHLGWQSTGKVIAATWRPGRHLEVERYRGSKSFIPCGRDAEIDPRMGNSDPFFINCPGTGQGT